MYISICMVDCDYCEESFNNEKSYIKHLKKHHRSELKSIDRKRIEEFEEGGLLNFDVSLGVLGLGGILILAFGLLGFLLFGGMSSPSGSNGEVIVGSDHYHGTIDVVIDGNNIDFSREIYQLEDDAFHFEDRDGQRWHAHASNVSLDYAMQTLDINIHNSSSITFNGNTYTEQNYNLIFTSNGENINPNNYILKQGDNIQIKVQ